MDLEPLHEDRPIHDELERTQLGRPIKDALDERGVVGAAAFGDVAVELSARLAGDDDVGIWGRRGVQRS